ncbi:VIT1/CCC1 transporter family protein [Phenylobacterium sp.]|uniref:VIT1/CCC1 transporter family protein n=1 Tax=Phenylobacterium sp. TaxID=1871053 RepID=UPI001216FA2F|nr:VIT1/CCC1 transporter family protein [Phenylobacterium sp.]THD57508.1 MAG: rubrerythrin family protein [Phenylobacterium sp.]
MNAPNDIRRYRANLQGEVDSAAVYGALAAAEPDPNLAEVYRKLAAVERAHAQFWRGHLGGGGAKSLGVVPSVRARAMAWLAGRFGPSFILPSIAAAEARDVGAYDEQPEAVAGGLPTAERSHARVIQAAASASGGLPGPSIATLEGRHSGGGGNSLRAAVLGANDGLVSNLSLVMGVAGAATSAHTILLTGIAGLVAGSCSMAMGEWLSVNSARELNQRQIATEAAELEQAPEEEKEELVLIYRSKGLPEAQARELADRLLADKDTALDTLAREELGIDPDSLGGSAWAAGTASFCLFALGAVFPVAPYLVLSGWPAVFASLALSGIVLAAIGAGTSLFTGRGFAFSASRQVLIGYAAAAVTFAIGRLVGVSLGA